MNWLVLGSGGREHAIAWKLAQSKNVAAVFVAPGNPGMRSGSEGKVIPVGDLGLDGVVAFCRVNDCSRVIIGPEAMLAQGFADELELSGIKVLGPSQAAARLESSKSFARRMIDKAAAPGPGYWIVKSNSELPALVEAWPWETGMVIKADGLAAGKGVFVCATREKAAAAIRSLNFMDQASGGKLLAQGLLCEELLPGREVSAFALCDGKDFVWFGSACDHKRLLDGDEGPNTGGMGAYAPSPLVDDAMRGVICQHVFRPVLQAMSDSGSPFRGFLFAGLMMTQSGPKILEFNVRLGDPETQTLLPLLDEDFADLADAAINGQLAERYPHGVRWRNESAVHVVKAARGYPGIDGAVIETGCPLEWRGTLSNQQLFYASVAEDRSNPREMVTAGGRVLGVTATGSCLSDACESAYAGITAIGFSGEQWRGDIAR